MSKSGRFIFGVAATVICFAAAAVAAASTLQDGQKAVTIVPAPAFTRAQLNAPPGDDWLTTNGNLQDRRYSTLSHVNKTNVGNLQQAWHIHLGIPADKLAALSEEAAPVVYKGVMYIVDGLDNVSALDATTGATLWKYTAQFAERPSGTLASRGVALGDGKVFVAQQDGDIVALDQMTGQPRWHSTVGRPSQGIGLTSAPFYYNGMVIVGVSGGDSGGTGFAAALNAKTGAVRWRWYVLPKTGGGGEPGGAIWINPSADPELNYVYIVTGNPVPWNGRAAGAEKWTDSIVALHADSGKLAWGYQIIHHDLWDLDVANQPILFDAKYKVVVRTKHKGVVRKTTKVVMRPGIAIAAKYGRLFILDRRSGKPLLPIPEKKVPQLTGAAEAYANPSPTQPIPVGDAFSSQCMPKQDWPTNGPDGLPYVVSCGVFSKPFAPGTGFTVRTQTSADWPPAAYSAQTHLDYVCVTEGPGFSESAIPKDQQHLVLGADYSGVLRGTPLKTAARWGHVTALNIRTNRIAWTSPRWSSPCFSGILTTAGDLLFAGQNEGFLVAYNAATGHQLWQSPQLDAGANAPAITYSANGAQYVAILAGGGGINGSLTHGDSVYAFKLP